MTSAPADKYWSKDTLFGYIDKSGKYLIPPRFNWALSFSEGLAPVCIGPCRNEDLPQARIGYIDKKGSYVLPPRYSGGCRFSEGLACAEQRGGLQGFIDRSGQFVIKPRFLWADGFSHGLAATDRGFINHKGDVVIAKHAANDARSFSGEWAAVVDGDHVVFVDVAGNVILRPRCEGIGPFSEDLAPACPSSCGPSAIGRGQNWGYINRTGQFVIKPQFGYRPEPFKEGLALVCFGCKG